ncbi:SDR family oxidoreductase [Nonomuraea solani]|uniref:SDR family oxidoreductase n=1 Tax=Nonomuraea solani TaxID=1144553 RepID=UPI000CDE74CB|nr:SDR family oxidoreductase [Nonomuraea solani]
MSRSVFVTGGNRGIGLAVAQAFARNGDRVAVTHRGSGAPAGLLAVRCDVTSSDQVDAAFTEAEREHGPVEVLVANAGIAEDVPLVRMDEDRFGRVVDADLTGAFRVAARASRPMLRNRWGRMIFMSSVLGTEGGKGASNYAAAKAGLIGLARSVARELGPRGVTANVVAPGLVETELIKDMADERRRELIGRTFLGRPATPEEVASAVLWLAGEDARYVTGAVIPVDAGLALGA